MSRYFVLTITAICLFTATAHSTDIYVNALAGPGGNGTKISPYGDLQTALNIAVAGDTIFIAQGTYKPSVPSNDPVFSIPEGVTLMGGYNGDFRDILNYRTILSGDINGDDDEWGDIHYHKTDNCSTVMRIIGDHTGQPVVLDGLFVKGGYNETGSGGGLSSEGYTVTIKDCFFNNNYASGSGGAIHTYGDLSISSTMGTYYPAHFENNHAGVGGAIYSTCHLLTMQDIFFSYNFASSVGGGLYADHSVVKVTNSIFDLCFADVEGVGKGGCVYMDRADAEFTGCLFCGETGMFGGGVYQEDSLSSYDRCSFSGCSAYSGSGGAFFSTYNYYGYPTLTNCSIESNCAAQDGGGVYVDSGGCSIINCSIGNCYSGNQYGAGVYVKQGGAATIANSILWDNSYDSGWDYRDYDDQVYGTTPTYSLVQTYSQQYWSNEDIIDHGSNVFVTTTKDLAGNFRIRDIVDIGPYEIGGKYSFMCVDGNVTGNQHDGQSWATAFKYLQDALQIAQADGAKEIWVADGTYYPDVRNNNAPNGNNLPIETFTLIEGVKIYGGFQGICDQFPNGESSIDDRNADITQNPSILSGNIQQNESNKSYQVVSGTNLSRNTVLDRFTIKKGQSAGLYGYTDGAGMILNNADPKIVDCVFSENSAEQKGGALFNNMSSPKLVRCSFKNNTARFGAAIFNSCQSSPEMIDCDFITNIAQAGGAVFNHSQSSPAIDRAVFRDNQANGSNYSYGGGMYNVNDSNPHVTNSVFLRNTAAGFGGAMYNYFECDPNVFNCTVTLNQSTTNAFGGFFHAYMGTLNARDQSETKIVNSIIWNNKTNTGEITFQSQYYPVDRFDTWYSCVTAMSNPGLQYNVISDPLFYNNGTDPSINRTHTDGLMLQTGGNQQCIDSGSNNEVDSWADVAMFERIQNVTVDRGAYEVGDTPPFCVFDNVDFDCTYCNLDQPDLYGWQSIETGCYSMKTSFLLENSANCNGTNSKIQEGSCTFSVQLDQPTSIDCLVEGIVETQNPGYDYGRIYIDGIQQAVVCSSKYNGVCRMELVTDPGALELEAGEHEIMFYVTTGTDGQYHENSHFDFSVSFGQFEPSYDSSVNSAQYNHCPSGLLMMPMAAPSR